MYIVIHEILIATSANIQRLRNFSLPALTCFDFDLWRLKLAECMQITLGLREI